jgi:hypothetical protein
VTTGQSGREAAPAVSARASSRLRGKRRDLGISTAAGGDLGGGGCPILPLTLLHRAFCD